MEPRITGSMCRCQHTVKQLTRSRALNWSHLRGQPHDMTKARKKILRSIADVLIWLTAIVSVILIYTFVKPWKRGFFCDDNSIRYPYKPDTVSFSALLGCGIVVPISTFTIVEILSEKRRCDRSCVSRCPPRVLSLTLVLLFGAAVTELVTASTKAVVSSLRPNFIQICKPNFHQINCSSGYITEYECTDTTFRRSTLQNAYHSFPSGHASFSAFILLFLILYIEARLEVTFSRLLKPLVQVALLLLALLCCVSRVADFQHHWVDVVAGFLIGLTFAMFCAFNVAKLFTKEKATDAMKNGLQNGIPINSAATQLDSAIV